MLKPIHLCADDFGLSDGINAGILNLAERGRLSATSCMSTARAFAGDAHALLGLPIQTGLHLNLTEPVERQGFYQPLPTLLRNCYLRRIDRQTVTREIERQFEAFESALGRCPDYVDGHQHVHQFPVVRDCLFDVLQRRRPAPLPWLRSTQPGKLAGLPLAERLKGALIGALGAAPFSRAAGRRGFAMNRRLLGVYGLSGGEAHFRRLLPVWLANAAGNDLLMVHPARTSAPDDVIGPQRVAEYAVLTDAAWPAWLESHGLAPIWRGAPR